MELSRRSFITATAGAALAASIAMGTGEALAAWPTAPTKEGDIPYGWFWNTAVSAPCVDGGSRTLRNLYFTDRSTALTSANTWEYVQGFIVTYNDHLIYWSGQCVPTSRNTYSVNIKHFWYTDKGVDFPVVCTSYDIDGCHWFGFDPLEGKFRIS